MSTIPSAVAFSHQLAAAVLRPGDVAIDGTAGRGNDTLMLARHVGPSGCVLAVDVQQTAVDATRERCLAAGVDGHVRVRCRDHAALADMLVEENFPAAKVVLFNLGYLPGGDKSCVTRTAGTLQAVQAGFAALEPGGILLVVCYPGHPGGAEESDAVGAWASSLPPEEAHVARYEFLNRVQVPPHVLAIGFTGSARAS